MEAQIQYRYRLTFSKRDSLRFVGHLDLAKTWERVFRRAEFPIVYSQGFNPQPKMQLASALPLGISSDCELLDVWCREPVAVGEAAARLNAVSPPGLRTLHVEEVDSKAPALQNLVTSADYLIEVDEADSEPLAGIVTAVVAQSAIIRERRGKSYDLRPLILGLELREGGVWARLAQGSQGTGRPDELLEAMGLPSNLARVRRLALNFGESSTQEAEE